VSVLPGDGPLVLRSATLADGRVVDVTCVDGRIAAVEPAGAPPLDGAVTLAAAEVDLRGYVLLPAPAEPHAHLDKAFTADLVPNPSNDLPGAIAAWVAHRPTLTVDDIATRALAAATACLAHGTTAIRTHVDVASDLGLRSVEALGRVRDQLAGLVDIQIVALMSAPTVGPEGAEHRALLRAALDAGADVVGGCPLIESDGRSASEIALGIAAEHGRRVDLHVDEVLDPTRLDLVHLAELVAATGFDLGVTASHCVSLGLQDADAQRRIADGVAAAGVGIVTLPITNLFLQARGVSASAPRAITAVSALLDAGAVVAAGADNVRDPFNPLGRSDQLETAALMVAVAHRSPAEAYAAVSTAARAVMGYPPVEVAPGSPAELVAVRAGSLLEAVGAASQDRVVVHRGRVVARTRVEVELAAPTSVVTGTLA
jgi:cytosine/creatinine deaminase